MTLRSIVFAVLFTAIVLPMAAQSPKVEFEDDDDIIEMGVKFDEAKPFIEPIGGMAMWSYREGSDFENSITFGGDLGFRTTKRIKNGEILRDMANSLYLYYHQGGDAQSSTYSLSSFRWGFSNSESYGYGFKEEGVAGLYLGYSKAPLSWFTIDIDNSPANADSAYTAGLRYFDGSMRFGESSTALIGVRVAEPVTLNVGFEWAQMYERHLFWYWALSQAIEGIADGAASWFVKAIGANSPTAMPIMHFILRNGVAMGFKALRMEQMNWPFTTEAPINIMTFRLGASINF